MTETAAASETVRQHILPGMPEAVISLVRLLLIVLFVHSFILQPFVIPSESMEHTLLVGDFLLSNKQVFAPNGKSTRWTLPYREVRAGDVVLIQQSLKKYLVKRVVAGPGDRMKVVDGRVVINGSLQSEPYVTFEPAAINPSRDNFPGRIYSDPQVDPDWWRLAQRLTHNDELTIPAGYYFVMGDNRNHSTDSRYFGLIAREQIVARPLVIYFSLTQPSTTDVQRATNDRLGHESEVSARLMGFARWRRIFSVVR